MSVPTAFEGEVQLRRWSESSTQGVQVTFALADSSDLEKFKGLESKRFMAVLVQIGDDEQPVPPTVPARKDHSWSRQAGIWCQDKEFQRWVEHQLQYKEGGVTESDARLFVITKCNINTRKQLDTSAEARELWLRDVAGPYRKWRIARGLA